VTETDILQPLSQAMKTKLLHATLPPILSIKTQNI